MNNLQRIMAEKNRPRSNEDKEGMARMIEAIRLKRIGATEPAPESEEESKNVAGVRPGGMLGLKVLLS
ncbi:MAG: hypothetical protein Q7T53_09695 [Deltaproteobacteria bacterium]|nr:hypothetical protein [Deltaproteobacteria bacterium]